MLKKRIVGVIIVKNGIAVQSIGFNKYLPIGDPKVVIEYFNRWGVDEISLLDTDANSSSSGVNYEAIREYDKSCQVPLSVGGGIKCIDDVDRIIQSGADKVIINTAAVENPDFITDASSKFGRQCIMISIDAYKYGDGKYSSYTHSGRCDTGITPQELSIKVESIGAGEIFINSINRDGSKKGYDIELAKMVLNAVNIPVVLCGGVGHPQHFVDGMRLDVSGVAAANYFNFTEHSVITTKSYILQKNVNVRLDSYATYENRSFDKYGRLNKIPDSELESLRFEYIPEEVI